MVYVGLLKDGREVAIKRVLRDHAERTNEGEILKELKHKNIVPFMVVLLVLNGIH